MKKYQFKGLLLISFAFIAALTLSCINFTNPFIRGNGNLASEYRTIEEVSSVDLKIPASVIVRKADEASVYIEADDNLIPVIKTSVAGNILYLESSHNIRTSRNDIVVIVETPELVSAKVSGSGNITIEDGFENESLTFTINGSGNITSDVNAGSLESTINGSGSIFLQGSTDMLTVAIRGSGNVNAHELESVSGKVNVMGSGNTYIWARSSIDARIAGSGSIFVRGNPSINSSINGSGKLFTER